MHASEASVDPQGGRSLSKEAEKILIDAARQIVADVGATYEEGLTTQVALLHDENEKLHAETERLREENRALREGGKR